MKNVMLDLETLGTRAGCTVLSIGAVYFGPGGLGAEFYRVVQRASCKASALQEDAATVAWWARQSGAAQQVLRDADDHEKSVALPQALLEFNSFLAQHGANVFVWGNGADFDNPILNAAYVAAKVKPGWGNWNGRCYRTLKGLVRGPTLQRVGTYHNALDDAKSQALHAVALFGAAPQLQWPA